jgi:hypothetical protein
MAKNRNWSVSKVRNMSVDRRTQIGNISATIYTCRNENKEDNLSVTRLVNGIKLGNMSMTMNRSITRGTTKVDSMSITRQMPVKGNNKSGKYEYD